jgi:hypothetical protein
MKKTITIYDGTVLEEGKKYRWSGKTENSYGSYVWDNFRCKIRRINGIEITIYDYENRVEYIFTDNGLIKIGAKFVLIKTFGFFAKLFKK